MAIEMMAELKHPTSELVFHRVDGSRWGDIVGSFASLVDRAKLQRQAPDNLTMHSLRHTFASWCSLGGLSLRRLQAFLGHKSITTTERYSHLGNAGVHPAYTRLANFLNDFLPTGLPTEPSEAEKREREELEVIETMWWRRGDSNARPRDYEFRLRISVGVLRASGTFHARLMSRGLVRVLPEECARNCS
jgi:hypothetical protein